MYYTKYFSGISLSSLKTTVNNLSSKVDSLKSKNEEVFGTVNSSSWECDAKSHFSEGFDANAAIIGSIKDQVTHFISAIEYAEKIVEKQEYMNTDGLEYSTLTSKASDIDSDLTSFKNEITSIDSGLNYLTSSMSGSFLKIFRANPSGLSKIKEEYSSLSSDLVSAYDLFNSIESMVSGDSYLKYAWSTIAKNFDDLIKKRDKMYDWITNYVDNLTTIENNLPDVVKDINMTSCTSYSKTRNYESEPSFDDYKSSAQGEEIKEPVPEETATDSGGSYSGSAYTGGGGGNWSSDDSGSSETSESNSSQYAKDFAYWKSQGYSDYDAAKRSSNQTPYSSSSTKVATGYNGMPSSVPKSAVNTKERASSSSTKVATGYNGMPSSVPKSAVNTKKHSNYGKNGMPTSVPKSQSS